MHIVNCGLRKFEIVEDGLEKLVSLQSLDLSFNPLGLENLIKVFTSKTLGQLKELSLKSISIEVNSEGKIE